MPPLPTIAVLGTFDTKGEEHLFIKKAIESSGLSVLSIHVGPKKPSSFPADIDLFAEQIDTEDRDEAIGAMLARGQRRVQDLYEAGRIQAVISAGGGSGTHLCTGIMKVLPLGVPKVMVSTVASRDMSTVVGTKDITMMHSVVDLLGVNHISGAILHKAAAAVGAMAHSQWRPEKKGKRIALSFFGFITPAAEYVKRDLEDRGYEVIAFHANGTGGMALEELADEGYFDGILDLATHELADHLKDGYCGNIGPARFITPLNRNVPRLVVPGGLDCAVLEFTRDNIPPAYKGRKIFFYDFRSAIRLNQAESTLLARQLADRLNRAPDRVKVINPTKGWSAADGLGSPLYDPAISEVLMNSLGAHLDPKIDLKHIDHHINDKAFARVIGDAMDRMIKKNA